MKYLSEQRTQLQHHDNTFKQKLKTCTNHPYCEDFHSHLCRAATFTFKVSNIILWELELCGKLLPVTAHFLPYTADDVLVQNYLPCLSFLLLSWQNKYKLHVVYSIYIWKLHAVRL